MLHGSTGVQFTTSSDCGPVSNVRDAFCAQFGLCHLQGRTGNVTTGSKGFFVPPASTFSAFDERLVFSLEGHCPAGTPLTARGPAAAHECRGIAF